MGAAGLAAAAYGTYAGVTRLRYGRTKRATGDERDELLDRFMPGAAHTIMERKQLRTIKHHAEHMRAT